MVPLEPVRDSYTLFALQGVAMENLGAHDRSSYSAWNTHQEFHYNIVTGSVGRDGSIEYDDDRVRIPLKQLFDDAQGHRRYDLRDPGDVADLTRYKLAMFTVQQQNAELLIPGGTTYAGESPHPGRSAMQQAYTDAWCLHTANDYNDQFGLEWSANGLREIDLTDLAKNSDFAQELAPGLDAAQALTDRLAERTGLDRGEILGQLNRQDADGKADQIAGWLLNADPQEVPDQAERIRTVLDKEFAAIRSGRGDRTGRALLGRLDAVLARSGEDRQTMSIGLPPPATGTVSVDPVRPTTGARTTPARGVVRKQ